MKRGQWEAREPRLSHEEALAFRVWQFCEGWKPEVIPMAVSYYGVRDVGTLMDNLLALRDALKRRKALEDKANGG